MSTVTTALIRIARHPAARAAARCAAGCAAAAAGHRLQEAHPPRPSTSGGHNRGCSC
ncbi:hypothetical protein AB0P13_08470 [Rhodococcus pyridinivorans]|uniref:Uncharacterized protein n=1 Tax=Rhodococcus pyridinivorans TaxID=103816 RepID=A0A495NJT5_9NOCA|nr:MULTISPECIES: hypothetical protein [Rhodococcus]MBX4170858.1 hypothetical protein [Rhodococcus sp. DMU2021]MCD2140866.1 hypothetical protein [Rhodococcus pyridinivorans]QOW01783.1 hypothetical protein INP59_25895 [Rhodococcus pyridinivorans]QXF84222.1 hypothetical protein HBA53_24360 [Rhodococcus pyridinivorans]UPK62007.1 hypothetical protein MYP14_14260 [Rhodococcus pyridinivorans]